MRPSSENSASPAAARKAELRRIARRNRDALGDTCRAHAAQIFPRHLAAALQFCAGFAAAKDSATPKTASVKGCSGIFPEIIALYSPCGTEADCLPLMKNLWSLGKKLLLPALAKQDKVIFRLFSEGDALTKGKFGIAEPASSAPAFAPQAIFLPLLAFDAAGHRLGYGGGYYDRAIAELRASGFNPPLIGLAFAGQELPVWQAEPHDIALNAALTEQGFRIFGNGGQI